MLLAYLQFKVIFNFAQPILAMNYFITTQTWRRAVQFRLHQLQIDCTK
jgi:hypothetical protein